MVYGWTSKASLMRAATGLCGNDAALFETKEKPPEKIGFMRRMQRMIARYRKWLEEVNR
jgi:hypothetical protein